MFKNQEKAVINLCPSASSATARQNWNGTEVTVFSYNPDIEPAVYEVKITKPRTMHQLVDQLIALYARDLKKIDHD